MHYAFDRWMDREFPGCPWERYADDIVAHCDTEEQARNLRAAIAERLGALGLELHPEKTKVVFCKDANRRGEAEHTSFDFLGYTFRARLAKGPHGYFAGFFPAICGKGEEGERPTDQGLAPQSSNRAGPVQHRRGDQPSSAGLDQLLRAFYRSELRFLAWRINEHLARWAMHKFKRFRKRYLRAMDWLQRVYRRQPKLFAHWRLVASTASRPVGAG